MDEDIAARITVLETKIDELIKSHNDVLAVVQDIRSQVSPLVEKLSNSPMLKMLGVR